MSNEEIIVHLDELEKFDVEHPDNRAALRAAIAMLWEYQTLQSSDTSARLAAIKDIHTERLIELAVAEADGLISIAPSAAELAHQDAQPNEPLTLEELRGMEGQPVWVVGDDGFVGNGWCFISCVIYDTVEVVATNGLIYRIRTELIGRTFKFYRRPPKEDGR